MCKVSYITLHILHILHNTKKYKEYNFEKETFKDIHYVAVWQYNINNVISEKKSNSFWHCIYNAFKKCVSKC